jgi:hypothetical protein
MPNPMKRLEKEIKMAGSWGPILTNTETWQVSHIYNQQQFIVDTQKKTCTCGFWELVGIPCRHAIAALGYRKQDPAEFVHNYYSKEKYAQCYGYGISAINGVDMWPKPAEGVDDTILPPSYKNGPGRPRKLRIRGTDEDGARKRRRVATYTCTRCSQPGHNALSCKAKEQCPKGLKRKVISYTECYIYKFLHLFKLQKLMLYLLCFGRGNLQKEKAMHLQSHKAKRQLKLLLLLLIKRQLKLHKFHKTQLKFQKIKTQLKLHKL